MRSFGAALALALAACRVDPHRSPVCGLQLLVGPRLIQDQMTNALALLTDAPRGLSDVLPARVVGKPDTTRVIRGTAEGQLALIYQDTTFPKVDNDSSVYGLLVVDDSTDRVIGLLVYESPRPPKNYPTIGLVSHDAVLIPLYGVRVNWAGVSNPRCPLFGSPTS
jgi:hypothetical protein